MSSDAVVSAPHVGQPLRLEPFRAVMLSEGRVADPASARAFARPYRGVARRLRQWEERGQVVRDHEAPAIYLHEYTAGGLTVRGFVGGLDLTRAPAHPDERAVWPHEGIHPAQVADLARRMEEMQVNPAPILLVHRGGAALGEFTQRVADASPLRTFTDRVGHRHRLWAVRRPDDQARLGELIGSSRALLADGHHRYAAYLELRAAHPGTAWDRGLAMLVDQDDTPVFLGAIHRVLRGVTMSDLVEAATRRGLEVVPGSRQDSVRELSPHRCVVTDGSRWATVATPPDRLAVQVIDRDLVGSLRSPPTVQYRHTVDEALASLQGDSCAALLPAPGFEEVLRIIRAGGLLPEKATSFQPKPALGVLMRSLRDG